MGDGTKIEWADASLNPIRARNRETGKVGWHCEHATPGCEFCYAEGMNKRLGTGLAFTRQNRDQVEIFLDEAMLHRPFQWRRPRSIFWNSMTDGAAAFVTDEMLDEMIAAQALTPWHRHLNLTKRPERLAEYLAAPSPDRRLARIYDAAERISLRVHGHCSVGTGEYPMPNVFFGCSVEDQRRADERCPAMEALAAAGWKTFVSYEPALGPVDWSGWEFLSWLISGGESGPKARPSHPDWHRAARAFCQQHGAAFHFKQWGEFSPDARVPGFSSLSHVWVDGRHCPYVALGEPGFKVELTTHTMARVGKARAGRLLDGVEHSGFPA